MTNEKLLLNKKYEFRVFVAFTPGNYHLGTLKLSPNKISIQFSCEFDTFNGEEPFEYHYDEVQCNNFHDYFILLNVEMVRMEDGMLGSSRKCYRKAEYTIKYVIKQNSYTFNTNNIWGFSLNFLELNEWIGNTTKQEDILFHYENKNFDKMDITEFWTFLSTDSKLICHYDWAAYHNSSEQRGGVSFSPKMSCVYAHSVNFERMISDFASLVNFFSLIIGKEINIENITLIGQYSIGGNNKAYMYFCHKSFSASDSHLTFFPLGTNMRFKQENIPEFPLGLFSTYFSLSEYNRNLVKRFLNARTMIYGEDKFLALFRLAEKLSFSKKEYFSKDINDKLLPCVKTLLTDNGVSDKDASKFIKRIEKVYESKNNTEATILIPFSVIKPFLPEGTQDNSIIGKMTKLRNDITHANEYDTNESTLRLYINLLDVMVIYLILSKLLGVEDNVIAFVLPRLEHIRSLVVPNIYYSDVCSKDTPISTATGGSVNG
jgi:hypothetical protein